MFPPGTSIGAIILIVLFIFSFCTLLLIAADYAIEQIDELIKSRKNKKNHK